MLSFFFRLLLQVVLVSLFYSEIGCRGMSFEITPPQLIRVTSSVVGICSSLSWITQSYINLTLGLQNAFLVRSLGLRVGSELGVPCRIKLQIFTLVPWEVRGWSVYFPYLMGISLCIGRGFLFGSALWSVSFSLSPALPLLLFPLLVACLQEQAPCTCSLDD